MRCEEIKITPEIAAKMLEANKKNYRRVTLSRVTTLAEAMKRGEWSMNGETIKFADLKGKLLVDGQHRLTAIVRSGKTIKTLVVYGVTDPSYAIDTGRPRNLSNVLTERGELSVNALGSALRLLWAHERGGLAMTTNNLATNAQLVEVLGRHPNIRARVKKMVACDRPLRFSPMAVLIYLAQEKDAVMADKFFQLYQSGEGLAKSNGTSSILLLRSRYQRDASQKLARLDRMDKFALAIKAWNSFVRGRRMAMLRFFPGREEFPEILGPEV